MTAVVITPSLDPSWVRPLASLRARGVVVRRGHRSTRRPSTGSRARPPRRSAATGHVRTPAAEEAARQARAGPPPRARRVRAPVLHVTPGPPARRDPGPMNRRHPARAGRGLADRSASSLLLCLTIAWAIDDVAARPRATATSPTSWPRWRSPGVLVGFVGAKVGWGRWLTYLVGALFAALVVPLVVGSMLPDEGGTLLGVRIDATAAARWSQAVIDLVVHDLPLTQRVRALPAGPRADRVGHLDVRVVRDVRPSPAAQRDRHRRAGPAHQHVADARRPARATSCCSRIAALFLLVRYHVLDEQTEWLRRRIGDPRRSRASTCAAGRSSSSVAVVGSLLLTERRPVGAARRARGPASAARFVELVAVDPAVPADGRQHAAVRQRLRPDVDEHPRASGSRTTAHRR